MDDSHDRGNRYGGVASDDRQQARQRTYPLDTGIRVFGWRRGWRRWRFGSRCRWQNGRWRWCSH